MKDMKLLGSGMALLCAVIASVESPAHARTPRGGSWTRAMSECRTQCEKKWPRRFADAFSRQACRVKCFARKAARELGEQGRATYVKELYVPCSPEDTFRVVSDLSNAAVWDPRVKRARKLTPGPVRKGTRFELVSPVGFLEWKLPYRVRTFEPSRKLELVGKTRGMRYRDLITFSPRGAGTRLRYRASIRLGVALPGMRPLLKKAFRRIGDDATRGIPAAVKRLSNCR